MKRLLSLLLLAPLAALAEAPPPPGHNVHHVTTTSQGNTLWRGGGPRRDTLEALRKSGRPVTLIDLRHPPTQDDLQGGGGRLSPAAEKKLAQENGFHYRSISALDKNFVPVLDQALNRGDVYIHCMYGVNRTGFAVGRYATAHKLKVDRDKLGERDWNQGVQFQHRIMP